MSPISNFTKIRPLRVALICADGQTDGQTDTKKLIGAFRYLNERALNPGPNWWLCFPFLQKIQTYLVFTLAARYCCPILADFGPSQQIFVNVPQKQIPRKSFQ